MFCTVADVIAEALVLSSNPALWAWWAMQHGLHSCLKSSNLSLFAGFQSSAGGCYRTWPRKCWHEGGSPVSNGVLRLNHPDHRSPSSVKVPHAKVFSIFTPTAGKKQWRQQDEQQQLQKTMYVNSAICLPFEPRLTCIAPSYLHTVPFWTEMYHQQSASLSDRTPRWTIVGASATWKVLV